jgi:hypothetical protein
MFLRNVYFENKLKPSKSFESPTLKLKEIFDNFFSNTCVLQKVIPLYFAEFSLINLLYLVINSKTKYFYKKINSNTYFSTQILNFSIFDMFRTQVEKNWLSDNLRSLGVPCDFSKDFIVFSDSSLICSLWLLTTHLVNSFQFV